MNACGVAVILLAIAGIPSQRTPFTVPRRTRVSAGRGSLRGVGGCEASMDQVGRSAGMWLHSTPQGLRASSSTISQPAPTSKAELPLVEIGTAMVTAEPVGNNFCGVRTAQGAALQPGVINRSKPQWHLGRTVWPTEA